MILDRQSLTYFNPLILPYSVYCHATSVRKFHCFCTARVESTKGVGDRSALKTIQVIKPSARLLPFRAILQDPEDELP